MNTLKISMIAAGLALLTLGSTTLNAQALSVSASGAKRVRLSDAVGKNQMTWMSDAPLEQIKGTAEGVAGTLTLDPRNLSTLRGTISAQVGTMKSGNATRDGHLTGAQWLDAAKHPTITFTVSSVSGIKVSGNKATGTATGAFAMHGVTKTISVPFQLTYIDESAKTRERAPGDLVMLTANFDIALADFGVAGAKGIIGSKVGEKIHVTAQVFGSTAQ
jgi:polyisoprenoid-binding protein YceI